MSLYFNDDDKALLNQAVTPLQVVNYLGIPTKPCGSSISILCPDPGHHDQHYGSCKLSKDGRRCFCYVCNKKFTPLKILELAGGYCFYDAMCILAQLAGLEYQFEYGQKKNENKKSYRRLSNEQKILLGLPVYTNIRKNKNCSYQRPEDGSFYRHSDGSYILYEGDTNPWIVMAKEEPESLEWLLRGKCEERLVTLHFTKNNLIWAENHYREQASKKMFGDLNLNVHEMIEQITQTEEEIKNFYEELGGGRPSEQEMLFKHLERFLGFMLSSGEKQE